MYAINQTFTTNGTNTILEGENINHYFQLIWATFELKCHELKLCDEED
jgi:hypothetical protein